MKKLLFMFAVLGLIAAPLMAQETETLPDGRKVKIVQKDGVTIIEEIEEVDDGDSESDAEESDLEDDFEVVLPEKIRKLLERVRKQTEELPDEEFEEIEKDGVKIKIHRWGKDSTPEEVPEEMREAMERMREQMKEMRKQMEERMEKLRKEFEKNTEDWENDPDAEVEEYEHVSPDGSSRVKVKIVRIRKTTKSEDSDTTPETPKKETERKQ